MISHNSYFDAKVQSVGFTRNGRKQTVGAIATGTYRFTTGAAERMSIISGEAAIRREGANEWTVYAAGSAAEIQANSAFEIRVSEPCAYWCEFLS